MFKCYISLNQRNLLYWLCTFTHMTDRKFNLNHVWCVLSYPPGIHSRISWYLQCHGWQSPISYSFCCDSAVSQSTGQAAVLGRPEMPFMVMHCSTTHKTSSDSCELGGKCGASNRHCVINPLRHFHEREPKP